MSDNNSSVTPDSGSRRTIVVFILSGLIIVVLFVACLFTGSVDIPSSEVLNALFGSEVSKPTWAYILNEIRVPMSITAAFSGAALGLAGLILQTTFNNPLAGPSILGVTTGASLGAAIALLTGIGIGEASLAAITGSIIGAIAVIALLLALSSVIRSSMMLLIVGILISYLTSSGISILNFFATQEGVHSFVIWGLGNFSGVGRDGLMLFVSVTSVALFFSWMMVKPLNSLLLGERYATNLGVNVPLARTILLLLSGILTAIVTAFCGPISFIGLAVPHIARLSLNTSNHRTLIPATILAGAATGLLTQLLTTSVSDTGALPVNAVTPIIGLPVVLYIILNRRRLNYFN